MARRRGPYRRKDRRRSIEEENFHRAWNWCRKMNRACDEWLKEHGNTDSTSSGFIVAPDDKP